MTTAHRLRRATAGDAEALARGAVEGVSGYGEFAQGWCGPGYAHEVRGRDALLADPAYHAFVAEAGGEVAGQVAVLAADATGRPAGDPSLGHLRRPSATRSRRSRGRPRWRSTRRSTRAARRRSRSRRGAVPSPERP